MSQFSVYSKAELVMKLEAAENLIIAQGKSIKELNNVIKMHDNSRDLDREQIKELIEQRNELHDCVKSHLKISDENRLKKLFAEGNAITQSRVTPEREKELFDYLHRDKSQGS